MEPNHLKVKEITYELKIRNIDPVGDIDVKRKLLRGVLHQEDANRSFSQGISNPFSHKEDVKEITESLTDLRGIIDSFSGTTADAVYKRISSRLSHISGRVSRLKVDDEAEEQQRKDLQLQILDLEADIAFKTIPSHTVHGSSSTPTISQTTNFPIKYVPPYKWNIQFTGSSKESVHSFLEKVETLREARGVSETDLFLSACDLFKDDAWIWFINNKSSFQNWNDLVKKLKEDFLPYFYEDDLWREINNRTQGPNEKITIFISCMVNLFSRLPNKPDELSIVNKIRRNLLPYYISQLALHEPKTVSELANLCKKLEEAHIWSDRYNPPPLKKSGLLEPDLSCSTIHPTSNPSTLSSRNYNSSVATVSPVRCWNCNTLGHSYRTCSKPKTIFCYGCGFKNVIKSKCLRCTPKNELRGGVNLDAVTSSQSPEPIASTSLAANSSQSKGKGKGKRSQN